MPRGRTKRRGLHQLGYKLDGTTLSLDMCSHCISFGCDPFAMSHAFRRKVEDRRRKGLCHCCGMPKAHCKCKSSENINAGTHTIRTHNNKKMRKAMAEIQEREKLIGLWDKHETILIEAFGEELYDDTYYCIRYHRVPTKLSWKKFVKTGKQHGIDVDAFRLAWTPQSAA